MKKKLKIRNKPLLLFSIFGFLGVFVAITVMTYLYYQASREIFYKQAFEQLSTINKLKKHNLNTFLRYRKADIQAFATSETVLQLSKKLNNLDKKYNFDNVSMDEILKYKEIGKTYRSHNVYIKLFLKEYIYKDIMIIDNNHGHVLFSANYNQYIGENINAGKFKNSEMVKVWRKVLDTKSTHFSDMHTPVLYADEPVMLIATPIFQEGEVISVLMLKLPSSSINEVLHFNASSIKSCETYAVGEDHLLRSDSALNKELTVKNSFNNPENHLIISENVDKTLNGESGFNIIKDYRGVNVLSAYNLFEFDSIKWVILSEIDKADVTKDLIEIQKNFYISALILSFFLIVMGYFIIQKIVNKYVVKPLIASYDKIKGFEDIINNSLNEIYIFSKDDLHFIFANNAAISNSGYSLKELQQMKPYDLKILYSKEKFLELINPLLRGEISVQMVDTLHRRKNETFYDVYVNLQLMEVDGVERFVAIVNDITEYKKTLEEKKYYYELSSHDHLTKIFNRQMFDELFAKEVERSRRYDFALSLILIDIDFFKKVNDTFGHQEGDKVLQVMSGHVKESLRDSDIFARWGGEEFVILMPYTDIAMAVEKAESLRMSIEKLIIEGIGTVTCSFGVAQLSNFENPDQIFIRVDKALYKAKEKGRNRVESIGYDGNNQTIS